MSKVLSFDQSTKISSFCAWKNGQYLEHGTIDLHKMKDTSERIRTMGVELFKVIKKYNPDIVVIEQTAQQSNILCMKLLVLIQGMIIGYCAAHDIETYIIEPSKWRSFCQFRQGPKVKRQELKDQAIQYVKEHYNLDLSEDECEAICIGEAAHKIFNL